MAQPITPKGSAEAKTPRSVERHIDLCRDGLVIVDESATLVDANASAVKMLEETEPALSVEAWVRDGAQPFQLGDRWVPVDVEQVSWEGRPCRLYTLGAELRPAAEEAELHRLQAQVQSLQRSNADYESFAHMVAHDLKAPVRNVVNLVGFFEMDVGDALDEEPKMFLRLLSESAVRMVDLVDGLIAFASAERSMEPAQPVHLDMIVQDALSDLAFVVNEKQATVTVDVSHDVDGVPSLLGQVMLNLVGNALKFTRPGQSPQVRIHSMEIGEADPLWEKVAPMLPFPAVALLVVDDGIGFAKGHEERVFEPLRRLVSHSEYAGSGLGLAIVRRLVEQQGGAVFAESSANGGATFTVVLPKSAAELS